MYIYVYCLPCSYIFLSITKLTLHVIATFRNAVILAAGRAIIACQGQTIALRGWEKNCNSVVP
jgi:hypothetical protein